MTLPQFEYETVVIEQINDTRANKLRYRRNRQRGNKASFFMLSITSSPLKYRDYMALSAKFEALEGSLTLFNLNNPLPALASFSQQAVKSSANKGSKQVVIIGNHAFEIGDFVQFGNHTKAYRISDVTQAVDTTITLTCPLVEDLTSGETMVYGENVVFQVSLESTYSCEVDAKTSKYGVIDIEVAEQS